MSYNDGMMALKLQMPDRVPRTEYSAERHWGLVKAVTGISVTNENTTNEKMEASNAFKNAWNYDFLWGTDINREQLEAKNTNMGHAEYESGGVDYNNITTNPFDNLEDIYNIDFDETYPRGSKTDFIRLFNNGWNKRQENVDAVATTGTYISLMSGMIEAFGWDNLLLAAGMDQKRFGDVVNRYAKWMILYFEALAESKCPTIMVHDDIVWTSGAFFHPDFYREYIFPNFKKYFAPLIEANKIITYTSDGDYTQFIDDIVECGVNGFVIEPLTDMEYIAEKYGETHHFIGNAETRVLLFGTKEDIENEVKRCMDIGKKCPGFFMAVGNHIPSNTPVDNALWYNECYEKMSKR